MKNNNTKKRIGNSINYFIAVALIISGALKLIGFEPYKEMIEELSSHYLENIYLLGIIAIGTGLLFAIPKTFTIGFIVTLVFLGGTIAAHMQHGDNYLPQIIFVLLTILSAYLKRPAWFKEERIIV